MENCEIDQSIYDLLSSSLHIFLLNLTSDQLKEISINMVNKFKENKLNSSHSQLMKLIIIYSKAQIVPLYHKFFQWKSIIKKHPIKSNRNNMNDLTTQEYYEERPRIPIPKYPHNNNITTTSNNKNNNITNALGTIQSTSSSNANNINSSHYCNPNINVITSQNQNNINHRTISKTTQNFIQRQEKYKKIQLKTQAKVIQNNEEEFSMLCPFNPQINRYSNYDTINPPLYNNTNSNNINSNNSDDVKANKTIESTPRKNTAGACLRLYEDSKVRNMKREQKLNEMYEERTKRNNHSKSNHERNSSNPQVIKQYEDYKVIKSNRNKLQEHIDMEQGITFTPHVHQRTKSSLYRHPKNNNCKSIKSLNQSRCSSQRNIALSRDKDNKNKEKERENCTTTLTYIKENGQQ